MINSIKKSLLYAALGFLCINFSVSAQNSELESCIALATLNAEEETKALEIKKRCLERYTEVTLPNTMAERHYTERELGFNNNVIMPHKMSYFLPFSYTNNINKEAYDLGGDWSENLKNLEAKFQISLKAPLSRDVFTKGDEFTFGFTIQSWWQLYAGEISRPFRETNYQPEFFYSTLLDWQPSGWQTKGVFGFEHQSNGRAQLLSRSWNRLYATMMFAKDDLSISFRPWWRIPEGDKETTPGDSANDNVDIIDYMGHFELIVAYEWDEYQFSFTGRENFKEHHGGLELGFTFPLSGRLNGYLQYANGYGESLIDYNHSQQRIGVGIALTDIF